MDEKRYERELKKRIRDRFPGCVIMKNDVRQTQGLPDILILIGGKWAMLEVKMSETSPVQPNQPYYVEKFHQMSFAAFINPGNEEEVLNDLQQTLGLTGAARLS